MSYGYQWVQCNSSGGTCGSISCATSTTYIITRPMAGKTLRITVTVTNSVGSASAQSAATAVIQNAPQSSTPPASTSLPSVSGSAAVGQTLNASSGTWSGTTPMTYGYQWQQCDSGGGACSAISGANSSSYVIASTLAGKTLRVT